MALSSFEQFRNMWQRKEETDSGKGGATNGVTPTTVDDGTNTRQCFCVINTSNAFSISTPTIHSLDTNTLLQSYL